MSKKVLVYYNKNNIDKLMGYLYIDNVRGKEMQSFEYSEDWLSDKDNYFVIDSSINLFRGRQWPIEGRNYFSIFADSAPDRWGRTLLNRQEEMKAMHENRQVRALLDSDYLLGVSDNARMGAIRFKEESGNEFLSPSDDIPPIKTLRELEYSVYAIENELDFEKYKLLLNPGSSLGGARPKANIVDQEGNMWIAKFPSKNDEYDVGLFEKRVYDLARVVGLHVTDSNVSKFSKYGSTFLIKRFDRNKIMRVHFESAMALLGKYDNDEKSSYLDIVYFIKSNCKNIKLELIELYKRVAFNILVKNTDDHLRNHGFVLNDKYWTLSPLYDVNINKFGNNLSLNIDEHNSALDTDVLIDTSKYYELTKDEGSHIIKQIKEAVEDSKILK